MAQITLLAALKSPVLAALNQNVARTVRHPYTLPMKSVSRFMHYVEINQANGCWEWTGAFDRSGYGAFKDQGKKINSHRWSYRYFKGEPPKGLDIDHLCRVRKCVSPEHLEAVTRKVNVQRGLAAQERKTHCIHGHEYTPENTYRYPNGERECRTCKYYNGRIPE